jgi:hypothetical protein
MRHMCRALTMILTAVLCAVMMRSAAAGETGNQEDRRGDLNYARVEYVEVVQSDDGTWCFSVTVRHNDEGWDHYANAWQVLDGEDNEIAWRLLAHPHDDEQPFTREKCDIVVPGGVSKVKVWAKCTVHGFGGPAVFVDLSVPESDTFRVIGKKR